MLFFMEALGRVDSTVACTWSIYSIDVGKDFSITFPKNLNLHTEISTQPALFGDRIPTEFLQ